MDTAKLFQNGQSQAVRLPKEYRFKGDRVVIKKVGNAVVLLPLDNPWQVLEEGLARFSTDFMPHRRQPKKQQRRRKLFE
ncbi:MAG: type II toxin-antitoxin system VapB family antitoxin [Pseudomonadota bacterium]